MDKITHQPTSQLKNEEILFFHEILVKWEANKDVKFSKFDASNIKKWAKENNVSLPHDTKKNQIDITEKSNLNIIQFITNKKNVTKSLIKHLRDAFAHNLIEKENGDILHFQNFYRGKCRMDGCMSLCKLKELIDLLILK